MQAIGLDAGRPLETLADVLTVFLGAVGQTLDHACSAGNFEHECTYGMPTSSWEILRREFPTAPLEVARQAEYNRGPEVYLRARFTALVDMFHSCLSRLLEVLRGMRGRRSSVARVFTEIAPTFGIFSAAHSQATDASLYRWAAEQGITQSLTLPGAARVLYCLGARERVEEKLRQESGGHVSAERLAAMFQRCVLVHEHFHAVLETGLDAAGELPLSATDSDVWAKTSSLNESLAAWMELHCVRGDAEMERLVWDYIRSGQYPHWPYAGAERIEESYQQGNLHAVREWITRLRSDPEATQADFDRSFH
jgi:hypothetical protein